MKIYLGHCVPVGLHLYLVYSEHDRVEFETDVARSRTEFVTFPQDQLIGVVSRGVTPPKVVEGHSPLTSISDHLVGR